MRPVAIATVLTNIACVVERPAAPEGLGSFRVELLSLEDFPRQPGCETAAAYGTEACPRPFAELTNPTRIQIRAHALDRKRQPMAWNGSAQVEVRPGKILGVGPTGVRLQFAAGESEILDLDIAQGHGATRVWVEDCGTAGNGGSFATGVSEPLYYTNPRIDHLNVTTDNIQSPMSPVADNVCAISSDPRYGLGTNDEGFVEFVGLSHGGEVNAPPAPIGAVVEINGCSVEEFESGGQQCELGPLIVTGISNQGFFVTDMSGPTRGFNHTFVFNFNYPENLRVGDFLTSLRGSPVEFAGSTQLSNPIWIRDGIAAGKDLLPTAPFDVGGFHPELLTTLEPALYRESLRSFGRNLNTAIEIEALEGALVCMDGLAVSSYKRSCDSNASGRIERGMGDTIEWACERDCYDDPNCTEESSFLGFGQWTAEVFGQYDFGVADPVKVAVISRDADPDFDPFAFGAEQVAKPESLRQHLRVVGNLRHAIAARPVWIIVTRQPSDIGIQEIDGGCPR